MTTPRSGPIAARLADLRHHYHGKVRDVYDAGDYRFLFVTSDRISAFDVVFPEPIPGKGQVLNLLSAWWFERTRGIVPNHLISTRAHEIFSDPEEAHRLCGRVALVHKTEPIRFECVVRGYLDGSAWREYERRGTVAGRALAPGLARYAKLPAPLFTPARKRLDGHDENITVDRMAAEFGAAATAELERISLALYDFAASESAARGLTLLDTKFEFGLRGGAVVLIDEIFTPDSSRYRREGEALDKQFLRDWLLDQGFSGEGLPPALAPEVTAELARRYHRTFEIITGTTVAEALRASG